MNTLKRIVHSVILRLSSFKDNAARRSLLIRVTAFVLALVMTVGSFAGSSAPVMYAAQNNASSDYEKQSIELYPEGEKTDKTVTLNGLMPKNATAEAVDVTGDYTDKNGKALINEEKTDASVIAAYDITITDHNNDEYQPDESRPIHVEITHPEIRKESKTQLWHISDDGKREQISNFDVENGRISFYATGFSVYEIVELSDGGDDDYTAGWMKLKTLSDIVNYAQQGFYLGSARNGNGKSANHFLGGNIGTSSDNNRGIVKTRGTYLMSDGEDKTEADPSSDNTNPAVLYYIDVIEQTNQITGAHKTNTYDVVRCRIYCETEGTNHYVVHESASTELTYTDNVEDASEFIIFKTSASSDNFFIQDADLVESSFWNEWGGTSYSTKAMEIGVWNYESSALFQFWAYNPVTYDVANLDGKSYGLFHYTKNATKGSAFMAEGDTHSLIKLIISAEGNNRVLYVDENNEVDRWTFNYNSSDNTFTLQTGSAGETKYLIADSSGISYTDNEAQASHFEVTACIGDRIKLKSNGVYLTFNAGSDGESGSFGVTANAQDGGTMIYLLNPTELNNDDLITFSADRVSVSDIKNGQKVIVYLRVWNETDLCYDMYAVDHNGSLYPCYASGGKILWLGDGTGSLEWEFTEYTDSVTKEPNSYYELYNPYSEKYLAPQLSPKQVLSDNTIGINMPGRRNGEFYSEIIAWDNTRYAYIGFRPNEDKTALEPCSESTSLPFYFATLEDLNLNDKLHEVPTIDNDQYGIKMKMVNFGFVQGDSYGNATSADITRDFFGETASQNKGSSTGTLKAGLLSSQLKENGYPDIAGPSVNPNIGKDFADAFADAIPVNHLFLEKVYNSSGYFEFDSCQNFATLKKTDSNGNVSFNTDENGVTNFTLYRELGTHDRSSDSALKHGQFFPYDTIKSDVYSTKNPLNLYSSLTKPNAANVGMLSDDNPRKYENLHLIQTEATREADYYFGMEMEASFVQTPSGLDAWGHDVVFEFAGDDDFWLYVDDELVLDLGGTHAALKGKVNFKTGEVSYDTNGAVSHGTMETTTLREVFRKNYIKNHQGATQAEIDEYLSEYFEEGETVFKDYSIHKMKVFYMERGGNASNLYMRFNLAAVTPGHVVVSKNVSGEGADELDTDFIEYPFQIYYTLPEGEDGEPGEEHLLGNDDEHIRVTYQNSNVPVNFVRQYRPPGFTQEEAYDNIYFLNPSRNAEIAFPDNTITYRIVECAVDSSVYGNVTINGQEVPSDRIEIKGDLRSYSSETGSADERPSIAFDNYVNADVIKDLFITKKLLDENNQEITDDPATFNFRLYLSSVNLPADEMPLANMYHYYVLSSNKKMCRFDPQLGTFAETPIEYNHQNVKKLKNGEITGYTVDDLTFTTSGFGAISGIPAGYTICVPGLPAESIFKVTEDVKTGYGLVGYERVMGTKINEDYSVIDVPSYWEYDNNPLNVGKVRAEENPQMEVHNKKGYSLSVKKKWSDLNITTGHAPIYTAVYVDGQLLDGTVKQIKSPSTSAYYFWSSLVPHQNGEPRTSLDDYVVKEVKISNASPTVAQDGTVTNYGTVTPVDSGGTINLEAIRTEDATPEGEDSAKNYDYTVSYEQGAVEGTSRADTISNMRSGGIAIRLFKWDSDIPLKGGSFTLSNSSSDIVGKYTSSSDGIVTIMYAFERNELYTLTQTEAPNGYIGIQKSFSFIINDDDSVTMLYDDGTTAWGNNDPDDLNWANSKEGSSGITAFVDVYNKSFNFKVVKTDSADSENLLNLAHFALYKQANTAISGYVKNKDPMTGFEDMITENGEVYICGGNSGRTIKPGANGSVYFLTETRAPFNYDKLDEDIIFRISPLGVPSLISDSYNGTIVETEDSYVYTLSVPNVKTDSEMEELVIKKQVFGNAGSREKEFTFTVSIEGAGEGENFVWAKNGETQTPMPRTGGTVTLRHGDEVGIALPAGVTVTVTENSEFYETAMSLNDGEDEDTNTKTFLLTDSATLTVKNTLNTIIPTGVTVSVIAGVILMSICITATVVLLRKKRYT